MKVIGIIGRSKSGKTTVIEKLIARFVERGFSVGSIKDLKRADYDRDTEGKNTYRHKQAGAEPVTARAENASEIMFAHSLSEDELFRHYHNEIVILEGFRDFAVPQVLTGCDEEQLEQKYTENVLCVSGIYAASHDSWRDMPCFDATKDGDIDRLCDFLLQNVGELEDSLPDLYCGGEPLHLSYAARAELAGKKLPAGAELRYDKDKK